MSERGQERRLTDYLLGGLAAPERAEVEERLLTDGDFHAELMATADDLIHAYLAGQLESADRSRFETHFLASPRRRERLSFVRDLREAAQRVGSGQESAREHRGRGARVWSWRLAAALLLVLGLTAAGLFWRSRDDGRRRADAVPSPARVPPSQETTAPAIPAPPPLRAEEPPATPPREQPVLAVVPLPSAPEDRPVPVPVSDGVRTVRLELPFERAGTGVYDAILRTREGTEVWRAEGLLARGYGEPLVVEIAAELLRADEYRLSLEGEGVRGGSSRPSLQFTLRVHRPR